MKMDKKSPLWDGTPQRTGGRSRAHTVIIAGFITICKEE